MTASRSLSAQRAAASGLALMLAIALMSPVDARQGAGAGSCRITGHVTSGTTPLPGVALTLKVGETIRATSTDLGGAYAVSLPPGQYTLAAELMGFARVERPLVVAADGASSSAAATGERCAQTVDLSMTLAPRGQGAAAPAAPTTQAANGRGRSGQGFQSVQVRAQADAGAVPQPATEREVEDATRQLLPPGFSPDTSSDAVTISGNMASIDRGMMNDRFDAIGRGVFDPGTGEFAAGFGDQGRGGAGGFGPGGFSGRGGPGGEGRGGPGGEGRGAPGGFGGRGGPGGPVGPDGFQIGGRGGQQRRYNGTSNYSFGGSPLDSAPFELRPGTALPKAQYARNTFGATIGGPVKIKGIYDGTRKTNFTLSYNGNRGSNLFDQYATVPTEAMRAGDFSASGAQLIDPLTHQPFLGNRIPLSRIDPAALALLRYFPLPNVPGDTRNFHNVTTTQSTGDNLSVRVTHNFTPAAGGRGAGGAGRTGGFGGGARGAAGRGRGAVQGTSVNMTAQLQFRRSDNQNQHVLPSLGGHTSATSLAVPLSFNIRHKTTMHVASVNASSTTSTASNRFAGITNVTGLAGINGVSTDPFNWGVPSLTFASLSSLRDLTPSKRSDQRLALSYSLTRPISTHQLRFGGDYRFDRSASHSDANANGAFTFTGFYTAGGSPIVKGVGLDFADFLLGLPQLASVQYGPGNIRMTGKSLSAFLQDDWRKSSKLTFSLGVRYELIWPFVERSGHMVNLDVPPDFGAAVPVLSGATGPFSGTFPAALLFADTNNVAPRLGGAWRIKPGTVLRGGYGISFNSGSYASIARQLAVQPPFSTSGTARGTLVPLALTNAFANAVSGVTNTYGVDPNYDLGRVQTWNVDFSRDLTQNWNVGTSYIRTTGATLDMVRAPNRGPSGLRIEGVDPFLWQTSEGSSVLNAGTFRLQRRMVKGIGGGINYTLAKSRDNASNTGGVGNIVAQDDQNLQAEWGLSSFDRRHQLASDLTFELPFGPNKRWLSNGGRTAALFGHWRGSVALTWQTGTPLTARVAAAAADAARGVTGTLRADYSGGPITIAGPTIDRFFNTSAFSTPLPGTFGTAGRNTIIGPGSHLLNASFSRDVQMKRNRGFTLQVSANNLLNTVNYTRVDTTVNSPTFGQVLGVGPLRSATINLRFRF